MAVATTVVREGAADILMYDGASGTVLVGFRRLEGDVGRGEMLGCWWSGGGWNLSERTATSDFFEARAAGRGPRQAQRARPMHTRCMPLLQLELGTCARTTRQSSRCFWAWASPLMPPAPETSGNWEVDVGISKQPNLSKLSTLAVS